MNEFSRVLHEISIHHLAYGFGYDDNNNQSSVLIVGSSKPLDTFLIRIESFAPADSLYFSTGVAAPQPHTSTVNRTAIRFGAGNQIIVNSAAPIENASLISLNGKSVRKASVNRNVISTAGLSAGTYYVKVTDRQGRTSTARFVK